jgi:hypothetical protein
MYSTVLQLLMDTLQMLANITMTDEDKSLYHINSDYPFFISRAFHRGSLV